MSVTDDRWTCPRCDYTVRVNFRIPGARAALRAAQHRPCQAHNARAIPVQVSTTGHLTEEARP